MARPMLWAALMLFVVAMLYLLSVPPVVLFSRGTGTSARGGPTQRFEIPGWAETYAVPSGWVSHTPLGGPMVAYWKWWIEVTGDYFTRRALRELP
jgi:hypothetical protein